MWEMKMKKKQIEKKVIFTLNVYLQTVWTYFNSIQFIYKASNYNKCLK